MSFLNYILANHWAVDAKVGRAALAFIERRTLGIRNSPEHIAAIVAGREAARAGGAEDGGGRRVTMQEISRPWDGALLVHAEEDRKRGFYVRDRVAVVPVEGLLCRYASMINDQSQPRGTSHEAILRSLRAAEASPDVDGVVLEIDSPGGTVAGTEEVADEIGRMSKPVVAHAVHLCCSGAYWIASQADRIVAGRTALVGNIGAYQVVEDASRAADDLGVRVHVVKAGQWKAIGVPGTEVTREQIGVLQEEIDAVYTEFVGAVVRGRAAAGATLSTEAAVTLADGRSWIGESAVQLKLADEVGSIEDAVAAARRLAAKPG